MRTRNEQEEIAQDWLEYAIEEWLYANYESSIDPHTNQLLKQMDRAWGKDDKETQLEKDKKKEIRFDIVWDYITRLRKIDRTMTGGLLKEPEILLRCAYAAARCKVYGEAVKLCKEAYPKLTANKHFHGVALWMLGTLQWLYADQHDQALQNWERSKAEDFEFERIRHIDRKEGHGTKAASQKWKPRFSRAVYATRSHRCTILFPPPRKKTSYKIFRIGYYICGRSGHFATPV